MAEKKTKKTEKDERDVEIEYEQFPFLTNIKTSEQIRAELKAQFEADKSVRDELQAKREKLFEELISLGLSEDSAKLLANLE